MVALVRNKVTLFFRFSEYMKKGTCTNQEVSDLSSSEDEPESWESERKKFEFQNKKLRHNYKKKVIADRKKCETKL